MSEFEWGMRLVGGLLVGGILLKLVVRWMSFPCQFCDTKVKALNQVSPEDQAGILAYFHDHERREPDKGGVFVCTNCRTVHDDFSGEKKSRDVDMYSCRTFCKVCGRIIARCEPEREVITCGDCKTEYRWQVHERSGYRFFTPPAGVELRSRAPGGLDSW